MGTPSAGTPNLPSVCLDNLFDDTRPESGSLLGSRKSIVEHLVSRTLGKTRSIVFDIQPRSVCKGSHSNGHVRTAVFDRVPEQVLE
jgi:hypothetical protein